MPSVHNDDDIGKDVSSNDGESSRRMVPHSGNTTLFDPKKSSDGRQRRLQSCAKQALYDFRSKLDELVDDAAHDYHIIGQLHTRIAARIHCATNIMLVTQYMSAVEVFWLKPFDGESTTKTQLYKEA